jgi:hypothetical protein
MYRRLLVGLVLLLTVSPFASAQTSTIPAATTPQEPSSQKASATETPAAPLPDIQTMVARVRSRNLALEALRKTYIFTVTQTADEFASNGSKKTHTDQYQAFFVGNTEIMQHLSRDGKPLSPEDAKKEQERVDKLTAELKAHPPKPDKNTVNLSASGLLKVATFTNPRRELINNRPTLVFDYKGDRDAPAKDLSEQIMRSLAGTLWVDEQDSAILHLTGSLQQNFHVAGGLLVNIKKGSWFDVTQMPVNGEIWFTKNFAVHVDGRFLLFKGFNGDLRDSFSDYRKLKTTVTILPGSHIVDENGQPLPDSSPATPPSPAIPTNDAQPKP